MRRIVGIMFAFLVFSAGFFAAAQPATAASYSVDCSTLPSGGTSTNLSATPGEVLTFTLTGCSYFAVNASIAASISVTASDASTVPQQSYTTSGQTFYYYETTAGSVTMSPIVVNVSSSALASREMQFGVNGQNDRAKFFVTSSGSGGGGGSSSSSTAPAPALETLTLEVSTGNTTCTGGSPTGYSGSWLQLPAADACSQSGPNANPNAKLLGWATSAQFPVTVAQQIVDLKYGPIDAVIDGTRMIFIPAGGWTFVSGSNNLFPIWSS